MSEVYPLLFPPAFLSLAGITPPLMQSLFAAAADLYALQPWKILKSETVIEVRSPDPRLVVVMGAAGQSLGISVYDNPEDLRRMYLAVDPLDAAGALCWLALSYETEEYLDRDDLQIISGNNLRVAGSEAYPAIARIGTPGPDLQPPLLQDLYWLEGCLPALCQLFSSHLILNEHGEPHPVELCIPVETSAGLLETRLRLPGMQV
jgi:hypothetical protein